MIKPNYRLSQPLKKAQKFLALAETFTFLYITGTIASRPRRNNEPRTFKDITSSIELIVDKLLPAWV